MSDILKILSNAPMILKKSDGAKAERPKVHPESIKEIFDVKAFATKAELDHAMDRLVRAQKEIDVFLSAEDGFVPDQPSALVNDSGVFIIGFPLTATEAVYGVPVFRVPMPLWQRSQFQFKTREAVDIFLTENSITPDRMMYVSYMDARTYCVIQERENHHQIVLTNRSAFRLQ